MTMLADRTLSKLTPCNELIPSGSSSVRRGGGPGTDVISRAREQVPHGGAAKKPTHSGGGCSQDVTKELPSLVVRSAIMVGAEAPCTRL